MNMQNTTESQKQEYRGGYESFLAGFPCPHGEWASKGYYDAERLLPAQL